jgi:hypothetical protein
MLCKKALDNFGLPRANRAPDKGVKPKTLYLMVAVYGKQKFHLLFSRAENKDPAMEAGS